MDIKDQKIILASSSPYRKELLKRLDITFTTVSPEVNERYFQDELISDYVLRLAKTKAESIVSKNDNSLIIAADQALQCDKKILGKSGNYNKAKEQLIFMSNRSLTFYTGLCLINTETKIIEEDVVSFRVDFRKLTESEIKNYLVKEKPYDCAGSFKLEKLGISLLKKMNGDDPTALIGLPLIRLCKMLRNQGVNIP